MSPELPTEGHPDKARYNTYERRFFAHVHQLLKLGYLVIGKDDYSDKDEETISGDLCEAIENALDEGREAWMPFYDIHNEKPVQQSILKKSQRTLTGKKRQALDLSVVSGESAPRLRFSIEAKRLHNSNSVSAYVGAEGLGCFINGEYAFQESAAGMLGYIQKRTPEEWIANIEKKMPDAWIDSEHVISGQTVKRSSHSRQGNLEPIRIFHAFLDLRAPGSSIRE